MIHFVLKHKAGHSNKVVDAFSRRSKVLVLAQTTITRLEDIKELYATDKTSLLHGRNVWLIN